MKKSLNRYVGLCRCELQRILCDKKMYICFFMYLFVCLFAVRLETNVTESGIGAFAILTGISNMSNLLALIAAFPTAISFCDDISGKYYMPLVMRSNKSSYIFSKIFICIHSTFWLSFTALIAFQLISTLRGGLGVESVFPGIMFYDVVHSNMPYLIIIIQAFLFSIVQAVYAVMGLAIASYIPNRFVAVTATFVVMVVMQIINGFLPKVLDLYRIRSVHSIGAGISSGMYIVYAVMVTTGYIILAGLVFSRRVGRRLRNEIV